MKRFFVFVLLFKIFAVSLYAQTTITRFAVVDMSRIISAFADAAALKAHNEKRDLIQAEIERQNQELQELRIELGEAMEKKDANQIRALGNEIRTKTQAAKDYSNTKKAELEKEQEQLPSKVTSAQITNAIRLAAAADGCSVVISKDAGVLWHSSSVDITAKVIQRLGGRR
jgi:Skp family chaperone for outer membrane proteins